MDPGTTSELANSERWQASFCLPCLCFNNMHYQPRHPTSAAFVRASTLSLGSIAFGSLIVTILDLLRMILNAAQNNANADGHRELTIIVSTPTVTFINETPAVEACLACCAACFVGILQNLIEYFNRY